jgi:hypothetical protein
MHVLGICMQMSIYFYSNQKVREPFYHQQRDNKPYTYVYFLQEEIKDKNPVAASE